MGAVMLECLIHVLLFLMGLLDHSSGVVYKKQLSSSVINTRYGKVRGMLVEFPNDLRPTIAYLGLRYADLDQGSMRFMPPKSPMERWSGTASAVGNQTACPQPKPLDRDLGVPEERAARLRNISPFLHNQVEDCLTLNIYVPTKEWNDTDPMPVMVFVHGESYETGTGNAYDGSVLSSYGDVIVVTLNYRLGVLGFLTTGNQAAMGNYALLDITQALHWLRENIASFTGDPQRVTLFGHGHGAALVNLLMLSPFASEGRGPFFQRAIIQSGSALSTWAVSYDPVWCTQKLAINVNCSRFIGDSQKLIKCLRERTYEELVNAVPKAPKYYSCFAPSVDGWSVLPKKVMEMINEKKMKFASAKVMFGITKNEAYSYLKQQEIKKGISEFRKTQIIRTYVQNVFRYHRQKIFEILDHHYTDWNRISDKLSKRNNIMDLLSDGQYVAPLMETAQKHAETADTYLYAFTYSTQSENSQDVHGIHGDELPYVFGAPIVDGLSPFPSTYTSAEKMLSEAVMTYWTNFAKTGNPNEPRNQTSVHGGRVRNRFVNIDWPKFELGDQNYLQIGGFDINEGSDPARRPTVRHHYRAQKLALWLDLIPKINKPTKTGTDPTQHLLKDSNNMSTFDEFPRLVPPFNKVFPSPPPMPPISPTWGPPNDGTWSTTSYYNGYTDEDPDNIHTRVRHGSTESVTVLHSTPDGVTAVPASAGQPDPSHSSVPLSITVAVGCSLLFLNILIFAGVFYQRERIKKLKRKQEEEEEEQEDVKLARKLEKTVRNATGPETVSLMSNPSNHQSPAKNAHPQPSPQNNQKPAIATKPPQPPGSGYTYTAIPTQSTSPMHRNAMPHGHPIPMNTFGKGKTPDHLQRSENDGHIYKKINKPNSRDMNDSNNAITIV
ncbi:neuroligin-4, X-linked-like isoform X2 [Haliotis cracherodii]|uniref:neuroligin-4, X-linked-like isoform X2 n=1 Tax=Haliotis rufescens TaxID=6454 RepID=UPI00201F04CA|nr:neuroligin-4, X-linked-like isoform X2 [Haliotis rufescens]